MSAGPARGRIGWRQELGLDRRRRPERGIVENGQILADRKQVRVDRQVSSDAER